MDQEGAGAFGVRTPRQHRELEPAISSRQEMDELSTATIGGCRGGELENEYTANFWVWKAGQVSDTCLPL